MTPNPHLQMTQDVRGEWVPAIPEPVRTLWKTCPWDGHQFLTLAGYRGHYALVHILGIDEK